MTPAEHVGRVARRIRHERGLGLTVVANRAEMSHANVLRFEAGGTSPNLRTLVTVAKALGCTVAELVEGCDG